MWKALIGKFIVGRYLWIAASVIFLSLCLSLWYQTTTKNILKERNVLLTANLEECQNEKTVAQDTSQNYYAMLDDLTRDYHSYRLRFPSAKCVPIKPANCDIQTDTATIRGETGLRTGWLFDRAQEADELRLQMKLCQDYLKGVMQGVKK